MAQLTFVFGSSSPAGAQPASETHPLAVEESILDVAIAHDVPLQHACGGFCACTTCHVEVLSGGEALSPIEDDEAERLESLGDRTPGSRLGCQAKLARAGTAVTVRVVNVDD
jgi:ferredoxin